MAEELKRKTSDKRMGKNLKARNIGVTKKEFFKVLDRASQPIKREAESDSKKIGT
jgi:hypothetical protein